MKETRTMVEEYPEMVQPRMVEVYMKQAWHNLFNYALAYETIENRGYTQRKLLLAIVSGADSALQSFKAAVDIGTSGAIRDGRGFRGKTDYTFTKINEFVTEKGAYEKFSMSLTSSRKGLIMAHRDILDTSKYLLSFELNPADDVAKLLGGAPFGLWIEDHWKSVIYNELLIREHLKVVDFYKDPLLFNDENPINLFEVRLTEEQADALISELLVNGRIAFNKEGNGTAIEPIKDLTDYAVSYNEKLVEKLSNNIQPIHDGAKDIVHPKFATYKRALFPVQAHAATAAIKRLKQSKATLIQGEMSTGKSTVMTAIADGLHSSWKDPSKPTGYHVCLMSPPSLLKKWPQEIKAIIPNAKVIVIKRTDELIRLHTEWTNNGRPKPTVPTFHVISFTTMRDGARIEPAVSYRFKTTSIQKAKETPYKDGFYCPKCGKAHQSVESKSTVFDEEEGIEKVEYQTYNMTEKEFGKGRRHKGSKQDQNAFCFHCGDSLWTNRVKNRYNNFREWSAFANEVQAAVHDPQQLAMVYGNQKPVPSAKGYVRRVAAVDYIRRKMQKYYDILIVDEVHMCKADNTAQGNALGSLAAAAKKVVAGTGTLFGGRAMDVYFLLWRLFPADMIAAGFSYTDVTAFNQEYGNIEKRTFVPFDNGNTNTNSRGGVTRYPDKLLPGISPFIFGKFLLKNVINIRLKNVWPDPVELIDTPTIFVDLSDEMREQYDQMIRSFQNRISQSENPGTLYRLMMDYGIALPDNPCHMPDALLKDPETKLTDVIWEANHLVEDITTPKEAKLQDIIRTEIAEGRKSIVYVRDTGSSRPERDVRGRLKDKLEAIGAKVCILDANTTKTDLRSEWLHEKIVNENYDVCIVSQELVKVGLDLLCTPTLIFYQFSWSLFTINQAAKRAYRIGQTEQCRLFYLAYRDTMQEDMSYIIAQKNKATAAISGDDPAGLSAMLGDEGDLRSLLLKSIKDGKKLRGSAEDWISQTTDEARAILANIGKTDIPKKVAPKPTLVTQVEEVGEEVVLPVASIHEETVVEQAPVVVTPQAEVNPSTKENEQELHDVVSKLFGQDLFAMAEALEVMEQQRFTRKDNVVTFPSNTSTDIPVRSAAEIVLSAPPVSKSRKVKSTATVGGQLAFNLFD